MGSLSLGEVARRAGLSVATVRRWDAAGLIPRPGGRDWAERDISHLRMLQGLRNRGYSIPQLREGVERGTLAIGFVDAGESQGEPRRYTLREAARELGIEPELARRFLAAFGLPSRVPTIAETEMQLLREGSTVLNSGCRSSPRCRSRGCTAKPSR